MQEHIPETNTDHLLEEHNKPAAGSGPVIGVIIIVFMLSLGALYFWGARLNKHSEPLPLIPDQTEKTVQ
jgi:hypothetical protein